MSSKSVVVLAPNGRRQNVKVTPNTTILQILEEVCTKQGFKSEDYDIRHHNKVLDATSIMRYTGLPNNAQLEMAAAVKARAESRVKVGLALESGNRIMGEFEPTDSLWDVIQKLCPDEATADEAAASVPVIFYLGREECGIENLKQTLLRSLGITSGGAILRFFKKIPGEIGRQANVSAPLSRPAPTPERPQTHTATAGSLPIPPISNLNTLLSGTNQQSGTCEPMQVESDAPACLEDRSPEGIDECKDNVSSSAQSEMIKSSTDTEMEYESSYGTGSQHSMISSSASSHNAKEVSSQSPAQSANEPIETIVFLGERNAVLFDIATAQACKPEDVPDDFFELTIDDAKQLLRDLKRRQAVLEERPLLTSQYRELQQSKQMLSTLSQYKRCVMKIQFPNQLVLQGAFTPLEKISDVLDFVRKYLQDSSIDFQIFSTPPKTILPADQSLIDSNCVPGALVYFLTSAPCPPSGSYIHEDIMAQACTASAAAAAAATTLRNKNSVQLYDPEPQILPPESSFLQPSVSIPSNVLKPSTSTSQSNAKVPKWFKSSNK